MDTPAERKAAKKRRLREKRAAANLPTPVTIADMNPLAITAPNENLTATDIAEHSERPNKAIEDLWRLVAKRAARKAWQNEYVREQRRLRADAELATPFNANPASEPNPVESETAKPQPLWDIWSDVRQVTEHYYYKKLFRAAPIAVHAIVEPNATSNIAAPAVLATVPIWLSYDGCDTVTQVEAKLLQMEQYWAESRSEPFPESIRNAIASLRTSFGKRDVETAPASEQSDLTSDIRYASTTTAISAHANTATPAIYITTATNSNSAITKIEQQEDSKVREEEGNGAENGDRASKRKTE